MFRDSAGGPRSAAGPQSCDSSSRTFLLRLVPLMGWTPGRLCEHGQFGRTRSWWRHCPDYAGHASTLEGLTHEGTWEEENPRGAEHHEQKGLLD